MACFNPRICKRCDNDLHPVWKCQEVSIHASVKDATLTLCYLFVLIISFNPRICKRCDTVFKSLPISCACFNPRICKRCDSIVNGKRTKRGVSIHASVKDATYT